MSKHWVTPLFILFFSSLVTATDVALIMGGGSESAGTNTRFDLGVMNSISAFKEMGYEVDVSFDGGHSDTEKNIAEKLGHKPDSFSVKNYNKQLDEIEKRLDNPNAPDALKRGDKIVLLLDDHGGLDAKGNLFMSTNDSAVLVQKRLMELEKKAESAHVKLGVVVGTCYSGKMISLVNNNTDKNVCIIASSQPNEMGSRDFVTSFSSYLQKGESLEDTYLRARANLKGVATGFVYTSSSPMISSPEGLTVDKLMNELHAHLLDLTDIESQTKNKNSDYCAACQGNLRNSAIKAVKDLMDEVKTKLSVCDKAYLHLTTWSILQSSSDALVTAGSWCSNLALLDKLGKLLESYDKDAQTASNLTQELQENKTGKLTVDYRMSNGAVVKLRRSEIAIRDWNDQAVALGRDGQDLSRRMAQEKEAMINHPKTYGDLMKLGTELDPQSQLHWRLTHQALEMADIERELYTSFYKQEKQKDGNPPSACRDFKL